MSDGTAPQRWIEPVDRPRPFESGELGAEQVRDSMLGVLLNFLALLSRNWLVVLTSTAMAVLLGIVLIRLDHPVYRAVATMKFEDKGRALSSGLANGPAQSFDGPIIDPLLTQIQVFQSRAVANEVVKREGLRLAVDPVAATDGFVRELKLPSDNYSNRLAAIFSETHYEISDGKISRRAQYGAPIRIAGLELTIAFNPGVDKAALTVISLDGAIGGVVGHLRGRQRDRTAIIDVIYENQNAAVAQRVANSAMIAFQELDARNAKQESVRRREFIEDRLRKTDVLLTEAEASHNRFRSRERVYSSQDKLKSQQADLTGIEVRRQELIADRAVYETLLQALQGGSEAVSTADRMNALVSSPGIAANPIVTGLYTQLAKLQATRDSLTTGPYAASANNPDVARLSGLITSTGGQIVGAVRGQIAGVDARLASLEELKRKSSGTMSSLPTTEAEESGLLALVEAYRKEAELLRDELQKAQIEEAAEAGQISLVDFATRPSAPIGTGRAPRLVLALVLGLALGSLFAYVLENYTSVVRRRDEVERLAMVPMLAVIPPLGGTTVRGSGLLRWMHPAEKSNEGRHRRELVTMVDARSHAAETFRTLRTNLLFSSVVQSMRKVIVTSAAAAEGKSTIAANLAIAFAQQGQRVLLVDCDLRRPRVHRIFGLSQIPGMTNALVLGTPTTELVRATNIDNLSVLTAGPTPPNPAELLGGARMREVLDELGERYDLVLLDTPPVLVVSDAAILSRHAGGTVFVVRAGMTQAAALRDAMQQLRNVGSRVLGTVLNDPDNQVAKFAGYGYYDGYYNDYYGEPDVATKNA